MSVVDEIKDRLDIVEVVSEYVALQKAGRNLRARCPFHAEKTPSFFVFPERQTWHCFGSCGTGGDVFAFVMKKEGIGFGEALKLLAGKAGVPLAPRQPGKEKAKDEQAERLYGINEAAAGYYNYVLGTSAGAAAMRHLSARGISRETVEAFKLGYSPESRDALRTYLVSRGHTLDDLLLVGLVVEKEGGACHDLFRNRLVIPIRNEAGKVVGFGGRALDDSMPKYLNSPQTALFDKSSILFGLDRARGAIKEQGLAIIVEGYMDVLSAHQHGIANVVASMGTSLTERQVGVLKRLTRNFTLALDADAAGEAATLRGLEVARRALSERVSASDMDLMGGGAKLRGKLRIINLPWGKDPDEVIREDVEAWRKLVEEATPLIDYVVWAVTSNLDLGDEEGRAEAAEQLLPLISEIDDSVERELYLSKVARLVGVDERTLAGKAARMRPTRREKGARGPSLPLAEGARYPFEERCLCLLLQHPELEEECEFLSPDCFQGTENREIFLAWREHRDVELIRHSLDTSLWGLLDSLLSGALPPARNQVRRTELSGCVRRLAEQRLRRLKALEEVLLSEAESEGNREQVEALLQRALEPNAELKALLLHGKKATKGA
ncbi:MAG: DNA primase [Chloroflexota bacterium]|nr:DNA primase [Chloroflexota bacterium]